MNDVIITAIQQTLIEGNVETAETAARAALEAGVDAQTILNEGLMRGADIVGQQFEAGEVFLPQLMFTARALKAAMAIITPELKRLSAESGISSSKGRVVLATIQSDIHDIGKNIVSTMLTTGGFEVIDLGVDVPIKRIISTALDEGADIIGCSAMLTTSMPFMSDLIKTLEAMGQRERFKVMIGGASVTPAYAERIGADGTAANAVQALQLARQFMQNALA
ncbi:cobalamin-dependent protein [Pelolinea submarina]|uniref:5-methyltetrahydrofolate--homocysteine methyltransferase/trimethylamine corrinoid protein n=1 Tax=Pelolinea submarina TaxID=913107 RepID=A0A347ZWT4_9CHLR|nr:cobalamin-dependent protein [Pelolinea submarina]REG05508.1 5-methyltetrahydrofolate--homocysteine methyltransferase/trimethylamine corrinoid protein [Pelolinea submarina]BBB49765.1 5-methyltetrahydrofolate--homocysteine methyltransferase [Pelolinea submarina]